MSELSTVPGFELDWFSRKLIKMMDRFFEDPDNKKRFEEWEKQGSEKNDTMQNRTTEMSKVLL